MHVIQHYDILKEFIEKSLRDEYGLLDNEHNHGPMSVVSWMKNIIENKTWCDSTFIGCLTSVWSCRCTVIDAVSLHEQKFRHDLEFTNEGVDLVLIFNGHSAEGHYSAAIETKEGMSISLLKVEAVVQSTKYNVLQDLKERLLSWSLWTTEPDFIEVSNYMKMLQPGKYSVHTCYCNRIHTYLQNLL